MDTDRKNITHHISTRYNQEIDDLSNQVLRMGGLVERHVNDALEAVVKGDEELARKVISEDYQVNTLEKEIDEASVLLLARRQPAASDLRLVFAILKTITDLERIADEAKKIARLALKLSESSPYDHRYAEIATMGRYAKEAINQALDAFARLDTDVALQVCREEQTIDWQYEGLMRQIVTYMMEDPRTISRSLAAAWAARALERIGDHARNIAENVIFLVKGKDVRHVDMEKVESSLRPKPPAQSQS